VIELRHPYKDHPEFHAFRKLTRGVVSLATSFQGIFNKSASSSLSFNCSLAQGLDTLQGVYDNFGDINDVLNEYEYYEQHGDKEKAHEAQRKSDEMWEKTKEWMNSFPLPSVYTCLQGLLIAF